MVQLATRTKRKVTETVKQCSIKIYETNTLVNVNVLPLGSYDLLIGMDCLEQHREKVDYYNKSITCLNEDGIKTRIQGIWKEFQVREISTIQLKKSERKGCQLYVVHVVNEISENKQLDKYEVLREFRDVFPDEVPGLPPKGI